MKSRDIGKGTYSKVFSIQNKSNFKIYFFKEILKSKIIDLLKLKTEINTLSNVDHPNLIKFFEIFQDERNFGFIMWRGRGGELIQKILEKLSKGESFSEKEAIPIFNQSMSAISYSNMS